jgi:hypothetical protein
MKSKLPFDMARYRRYQEPFVLRVEKNGSFGEVPGDGSARADERRNAQATSSATDRGLSASYLREEKIWTTQ